MGNDAVRAGSLAATFKNRYMNASQLIFRDYQCWLQTVFCLSQRLVLRVLIYRMEFSHPAHSRSGRKMASFTSDGTLHNARCVWYLGTPVFGIRSFSRRCVSLGPQLRAILNTAWAQWVARPTRAFRCHGLSRLLVHALRPEYKLVSHSFYFADATSSQFITYWPCLHQL